MLDIVLFEGGSNKLSASADVGTLPIDKFVDVLPKPKPTIRLNTIWSKLDSLNAKLNSFQSELMGSWDKAVSLSAITIQLDKATQKFPLSEQLLLPGLLFKLEEGKPRKWSSSPRLLTAEELQGDIKLIASVLGEKGDTVANETKAHAEECLSLAKKALRRELQLQKFKLEGAGFLGIKDVGAAAAEIQLALTIDVAALLVDAHDEVEVLRASLSFSSSARLTGTTSGTVNARLELVVSAIPSNFINAKAEFLSSFDFPLLPKIPRPRLRFPKVELPSLSLDGVNWPNIDADFFDFDLKLPGFGSAPVKVVWDTKPAFNVNQLSPLQFLIGPGEGALKSAEDVLAHLTGVSLRYDGGTGQCTVSGEIGAMQQEIVRALDPVSGFDLGGHLPVTIDIAEAKTTITTGEGFDLSNPGSTADANAKAKLTLGRVVVRSKEDPRLFLAFAAEFDASASAAAGGNPAVGARLTSLKVIEPYPVELIYAAGTEAIEGMLRLVAMIKLPKTKVPDLPGLPVPDLSNLERVISRLSDLLVSALKWIAHKSGAALSQLAEAGIELLGRLIEMLRDAADEVLSHMAIEVRLDAETYHLRQILISPVLLEEVSSEKNMELEAYGLKLTIPRSCQPSLLIDVSGPFFAALLVEPPSDPEYPLKIATDLWLDRDGAPPQSAADTDEDGKRPSMRLITLKATKKAANLTLALITIDDGTVGYFQVLTGISDFTRNKLLIGNKEVELNIPMVQRRPAFRPIDFEKGIVGSVKLDTSSVARLLPFFDAPSATNNKLSQYIKVRGVGKDQPDPTLKVIGSSIVIPLPIQVNIDTLTADADLKLTLDLSTLSARVTGGDAFVIRGVRKHGTMFGLEYIILPRPKSKVEQDGSFNQFQLDLSGGNPRMALHPDAEVKLFYRRLGGEGRGLSFIVDDFAVSKSGFDLIARVDPNEPVTLPGVDMPFRFVDGQLVVKNGRVLAFSITGTGQLPPELVGEASCKVKIMLGQNSAGDLAVLSCDAELDKTDDPIVCHGTRFTLTIAKLGFAVEDFGTEGGYQFYFTVTGSLVFTPPGDEFGKTFLKYLRGAKLTLNKAPLGRDMRLLARSIEIQVPLDPKVNFNLFEIFAFEVRGFGFHPASPAFDGSPAMNISGQVKFREAGDVISAKIDCHSLWIAPPKPDATLPRVRFDGLTVAMSLNGAGSIEGTALTVDENLSELERPFALPPGVTANGFLASGQLKLSGWAPMTASMGFLELKEKKKPPRHAFYLYGEMEKLSVLIPTPVKELYLREAGFGFGYRYTLAGLARADQVTTPSELIRVLDDVSRNQGDLAKFSSWQPEFKGDRITLAMRALATVASPYSSSEEVRLEEQKLKADEKSREEGFANPLLFDMAIALRSDLTLLMTTRAWFSVNYDTWTKKKEEISNKPPLRGYLYLSAPRKELLARLVSDPEGYIGDTPKLPNELVDAFRSVHFSSTLYIRPGLFHFEFGWPYELKLTLPRKPDKNFGLTAEGGLVFRVEDFSLLYGIAIRARGFAQFGGSVGGSSLGASALARADFSLDAKFIAYLSLERASETLFYGSLAFSCSLSFEIKFWVEIDIGFDSIRLSASFSQSFAISAALEVAIGPSVLAGRAAVAISVGAFGRSLTLSVGFGFNEGALVDARRKVERFLALGLTSAVPDPVAGLAPPAPPTAVPPAKTEDFEKRAEEAATLGQIDSRPKAEPEKAYDIKVDDQFKTFTPNTPLFWAMLFELPAMPGTYVMQLVPRDATQAFTGDEISGNNVDLATIVGMRSTFYGPAGSKFKFTAKLKQLKADKETGQSKELEQEELVGPDVDVIVAVSGSGSDRKELKLKAILDEAYLSSTVTYDPKKKQIIGRKKKDQVANDVIDVVPEKINVGGTKSRTRAEAEAELASAADASAKLSVARALLRGVEEKRSALISAICSSAEQIAREATLDGSNIVWPRRPKPTAEGVIDARDFGLTFVVSEGANLDGMDDTLAGLFSIENEGKLPPKAKFMVQLVDAQGLPIKDDEQQPIRLFNPPSRFFDRANPRLARFTGVHDSRGVVLDWDLEPAWENSANVWHDPEFHLKCYRIQRVFKVSGRPATKLKPLETTTKAAAPLKPVVKDGGVEWQKITPPAQFVDDFADLPENFRPALLRATTKEDSGQAEPVEAWLKLFVYLGVDDKAKIELAYVVQAIDTAGREAVPVPFEITIEAPVAVVPRIAQAELFVAYTNLPSAIPPPAYPTKAPDNVSLSLRIDDLLDAKPKDRERPQRLAPSGTKYLLRVRREISTPLGIYGADAATTALKRPTPDQFETKLADDVDVDLTLIKREDTATFSRAHALDEIPIEATRMGDIAFTVNSQQLDAFNKALGLTGDQLEPRSVRVAIQRKTSDDGKRGASAWIVVDTRLRIGEPGNDDLGVPQPRPVDTVVETFESPKAVGFKPLAFEDMAGEAGRLLIDYPAHSSTLKNLISSGGALQRLRDGDRRVATRVRWNAVPSIDAGPPSLIGGYDVFEADLTSSLTRDDIVGVAQPIARVAALDPVAAAGEPATIEDYGAIEAFYPSETLRLSNRDGAARRRAWFSPAESLGVWPEVGIRRSVGLTIPDAEVAQLFVRGAPTSVIVRFEGANKPEDTPGTSKVTLSAAVLNGIAINLGKASKEEPKIPSLAVIMDGIEKNETSQHENVFSLPKKDGKPVPFTYIMLRRLLHSLVIDGSTGGDWWNDDLQKSFAKHRAALHGLTIEIEAKRGDVSIGTITQKVDLDTALHPVLADVLDAMRWHDGQNQTPKEDFFYRRYEPVVDPAPPTDATSIGQFLDQRPIERDPYGWAILRTLGLAAGFRISDTLSGDFLRPEKAIKLVSEAFATILPRYEHLQLGQPFVDLMTRAGGLYTVASFDGGDTTPGEKARTDILNNELVSLVQIALRPVAERLLSEGEPVGGRYYAVSPKEFPPRDSLLEFTIDMKGREGLVDLKILNTSLVSSANATLAGTISNDPQSIILRLSGQRPTELKRSFTIPASSVKSAKPFAILRMIKRDIDSKNFKEILDNAIGSKFDIVEINHPRVISGSVDVEAFERFPDLPPSAITELLTSGGADVHPHFESFLTLAKARFGEEGVPKLNTAELDAFFVRWPDLMRRFFTHGPSATRNPDTVELPFSLALMPRPMPLRTKVQDDGTMEMVVVHKDRLARRRRYFVRPFGRYDNITAAWHATHTDPIPWAGRRLLADSISEYQAEQQSPLPAIKRDDIDGYSLDITVPRSEPLAPPVVLSARRLDVGEGVDQRPGKLIEFVVARHQEEIASESNITVADSLQFEHLAFGFYREFRDNEWASKLRENAGWQKEELDLLPAVTSDATLDIDPDPNKRLFSFPSATSFSEKPETDQNEQKRFRKPLSKRLPDGWRGITALRTEDTPHFYRVHAVVFAAAGVVVSEPVVASIPEGQFTLTWPWVDDPNHKLTSPTWSVTEKEGKLSVAIETPLVRYFDGMLEGQKKWSTSLSPEKRRVYNLPDPGVAYEVVTGRLIGKAKKEEDMQFADAVTEATFAAQPADGKLFRTTWPGGRFTEATISMIPVDAGKKGWQITLPLERFIKPPSETRGAQPEPLSPEQRFQETIKPILQFASSFEMVNDTDWAAFSHFAPSTVSGITFIRPAVSFTPPDIPPHFNDVESQNMGQEAQEILNRLQDIKDVSPIDLGDGWNTALKTLAEIADFANISGADAYQKWLALMPGDPPVHRVELLRFAGMREWPLSKDSIKVDGLFSATWGLKRPQDVSFELRAPALAAMRRATAVPDHVDGKKKLDSFRIGLFTALWWEDRADVLLANEKALTDYPMLAGVTLDPDNFDLGDVAQSYVALFNGGGSAPKPSPGLEFLSRLDVALPPDTLVDSTTLKQFKALLDYLTKHELYVGRPGVGFGSAIEALLGIEIGETSRAELLLPTVELPAIKELIIKITGATATKFDSGKPIALNLRRPPTDAEVWHVNKSGVNRADELHKFVDRLATDQIFGAGRKPRLKATKGFLDAKYKVIARKED